jgi:uncharacterized protein
MNFDDNNPLAPDPAKPGESPMQASSVADGEPLQAPADFAPAIPSGPQIPDDLRVPWGWGSLVLFVLMYFILGLLVVIGLAAYGVKPADIQKFSSKQGPSLILSQVVISLALLGYLAAEMRYHFGLPFWRTIGWRPLQTGGMPRVYAYGRYVLGGLLLSMVVQLASAAIKTKTKLPIENILKDPHTAIMFLLIAVTLAPVLEETVFRGFIYPVIARSFGVGTSIVVTGTLFGMLHAQQLWPAGGQIALLVVVGIVFTYVRSKARTVVASFLLHLGYNGLLFIEYFIASQWFHKLPGG